MLLMTIHEVATVTFEIADDAREKTAPGQKKRSPGQFNYSQFLFFGIKDGKKCDT
jgi:hypothetical protein